MELKKTPQADLESKKRLFILIGLTIALSITYLAFEWATKIKEIEGFGEIVEDVPEEDIIEITREELKPPPPPPPPPKVIEVINIVDSDEDIEDELDLMDTEADVDMEIVEMAEEEEEEEIFVVVQQMPEFPGGNIALQKYIAKNIVYPTIAMENGISGKVFIQFVVEKNGKVGGIKVIRGVDEYLDKEAVRVVKSLPDFTPGKQRGKPVRVYYTVPINFQLE